MIPAFTSYRSASGSPPPRDVPATTPTGSAAAPTAPKQRTALPTSPRAHSSNNTMIHLLRGTQNDPNKNDPNPLKVCGPENQQFTLTLAAEVPEEIRSILEEGLKMLADDMEQGEKPWVRSAGGTLWHTKEPVECVTDGETLFSLALSYKAQTNALCCELRNAETGEVLWSQENVVKADASGVEDKPAEVPGAAESSKRKAASSLPARPTTRQRPSAATANPPGGGSRDFLSRFEKHLQQQLTAPAAENTASGQLAQQGFQESFDAWKKAVKSTSGQAPGRRAFMALVKKHCTSDNQAGTAPDGTVFFRIKLPPMETHILVKRPPNGTLHCLSESDQKRINSDVETAWSNTYEKIARETAALKNKPYKSLNKDLPTTTDYNHYLSGMNFMQWASNKAPAAPFALPLLSWWGLQQALEAYKETRNDRNSPFRLLEVLQKTYSDTILPYPASREEATSIWEKKDTGSLRKVATDYAPVYAQHEQYKKDYYEHVIGGEKRAQSNTERQKTSRANRFIDWMSAQAIERAMQGLPGTSNLGRLSPTAREKARYYWRLETSSVAGPDNRSNRTTTKKTKDNKKYPRNHFLKFLEEKQTAEKIEAKEDYVPLPPEQPAASSSAQE